LPIKQAFPHNFKVYQDACRSKKMQTGSLLVVKDSNLLYGDKLIINLPTKVHWKQPSEYHFIETGLSALCDYLKNNPIGSLALPALGCGSGGLDWQVVRSMIEQHLAGIDILVTVYEP
jgi:O-acetyl-ADP-ribose deacetylase (regulator of RNase III)